jgi:type VI secretion system secreted protein Hcp
MDDIHAKGALIMQANTYLNYEGIKGETTAEEFKDMITVLSVDWNVSREITSFTGTAKDREASSTRLGDVTITKLQDNSSTDLFKEATIGKGKKAVFHITKQGDKIEEIMQIELTDAMISSYSVSVHGDRPVETITISYTEMMMAVTPTDDKNNITAALRYGYSGVKGQQM